MATADFAERLDVWLETNGSLVEALLILRRLGNEDEAVAALLATRPVQVLRLSWELWVLLTSEPNARKMSQIGGIDPAVHRRCVEAVWGVEPYPELKLLPPIAAGNS